MRRLALLAVVLGCQTAAPIPDPPAPPPPPVSNILEQLGAPQYAVSPLPGRATGLLLAPVSRWGRTLSAFIVPGSRHGDPPALYELHAGTGLRPWTVLFRCDTPCGAHWQEGAPVVAPHGELLAQVGAGLLGPGVGSAYPLGGEAHLVELEVNGGAGAGTAMYFVATDVRPLPGVEAEAMLDAALRAFEGHVTSQEAALRAMYEREWRELSGMRSLVQIRDGGGPPPPPLPHTVVVPRWLGDGVLELTFIRRWVSSDRSWMESMDETPCGFPSRDQRVETPPWAGVELGQRLRVLPSGEVSVLETFPLGILDDRGRHFAHIPIWEFRSRRNCPGPGAPNEPPLTPLQ